MRIRHYFLLVMCVVALVLSTWSQVIYAQDTSNHGKAKHYWVNAGFGFSSPQFRDGIPFSMGMSFSYQTGKSLISLRSVYNIDVSFNIFGGPPPLAETAWDIGVLYGRIAKASYGFASISGGVSIVGGLRAEEGSFLNAGIPIEGQLFWTPTSLVGVGIYGFANLNKERSFAGALLCIQIGKLR